MIASANLLSFMVIGALVVTTAAPILLVVFWILDWKNGKLW